MPGCSLGTLRCALCVSTWKTSVTFSVCMSMCVYVCMYVCMCVYGWMGMYVRMYVRMHVCMHVFIHVCMHVFMHVRMYACMHVCMHACMRARMHACMHACMHVMYVMYACMHACIRTFMHLRKGPHQHEDPRHKECWVPRAVELALCMMAEGLLSLGQACVCRMMCSIEIQRAEGQLPQDLLKADHTQTWFRIHKV